MPARKKGGQRLTEMSKKSRTKTPKLVDGKDGYRKGDPVKTFKPPKATVKPPKQDPVKTLTTDKRKDQVEKKRARRRQMLKIEQEGLRKEGKHWDKYLSQDKFNLKEATKKHLRRQIPPILKQSSWAKGAKQAVKQGLKQMREKK